MQSNSKRPEPIMKTRFSWPQSIAVLALTVTHLCSTSVAAQDSPKPDRASAPAASATQRITIDEAPLGDCARWLKQLFGVDVVVSPEVAGAVVGRLDVRAADLETVLAALKVATGEAFAYRFADGDLKTVFLEPAPTPAWSCHPSRPEDRRLISALPTVNSNTKA